jgi:hypothetical protein
VSDVSDDSNNVIPETELERRRMAMSAMEELADAVQEVGERIRELHDYGVSAEEWLQKIAQSGPPLLQVVYDRWGTFFGSVIDGFVAARAHGATSAAEGMFAAISSDVMRAANRPRGDRVELPPDDVTYWAPEQRMRALIDRLFAEAPKLTHPDGTPRDDQAPALECQIMLKAGGQIGGSLSVTPEGTLRLLSPMHMNPKTGPLELVMVEHFFNYEEVSDIAVIRKVDTTPSETSRIVTA